MTRLLPPRMVAAVAAAVIITGCATPGKTVPAFVPGDPWCGTHIYMSSREDLPLLHRAVEEVFAPRGLNVLVLEVGHCFQYESHPELSPANAMTKDDARQLVALCEKHGIRVIPQFQCFGHQGHRPNLLLSKYPELMAPPNPDYDDPKHYQVSWNPLHPKTNEIVFPMIDEVIDAFQAEMIHVGMDEVMLFPDKTTPYYNGETNAQIFAKAVNDVYDHVVKKKGLTMLMWGDRLLDRAEMGYNWMESSSENGTAPAIDDIPKDIIICDWHYFRRKDYPSVPFFQDRGFRVWPTSWRSPSAALAFLDSSLRDGKQGLMLGHLCSSWCGMPEYCRALIGESTGDVHPNAVGAADTFRAISDVWLTWPRQ